MLCGWYDVHTSGIQRSHHYCYVNYDDLKNCIVHCKYLVASDMDVVARSEDDETRKQWSQHKLDNALAHNSLLTLSVESLAPLQLKQFVHLGKESLRKVQTCFGESSSIQEGCL